MSRLVVKKIEDKEIVWFKNSNLYLVLEQITADILLKIDKKNSLEEIETWAFKKITAPKNILHKFIEDVFLFKFCVLLITLLFDYESWISLTKLQVRPVFQQKNF